MHDQVLLLLAENMRAQWTEVPSSAVVAMRSDTVRDGKAAQYKPCVEVTTSNYVGESGFGGCISIKSETWSCS